MNSSCAWLKPWMNDSNSENEGMIPAYLISHPHRHRCGPGPLSPLLCHVCHVYNAEAAWSDTKPSRPRSPEPARSRRAMAVKTHLDQSRTQTALVEKDMHHRPARPNLSLSCTRPTRHTGTVPRLRLLTR